MNSKDMQLIEDSYEDMVCECGNPIKDPDSMICDTCKLQESIDKAEYEEYLKEVN